MAYGMDKQQHHYSILKAAETNKTCYQLMTILTPKNYKGVVAG